MKSKRKRCAAIVASSVEITTSWAPSARMLVGVYFVQQPHNEVRQEFEYIVKSTLS